MLPTGNIINCHEPVESNPNCAIYYPCQKGQEPTCDEIVVFQKAQTVPRFWIELEVEAPYLMTPSNVPLFVSELIPHLIKMLQNPHVDRDLKLHAMCDFFFRSSPGPRPGPRPNRNSELR